MEYILNRTAKGIVFKCSHCQKIHIEFNNINLNLAEKEYREFSCHIQNIDGEYWEKSNERSIFNRKIRIPIFNMSICLMLNLEELKELQELLFSSSLSAESYLLMQVKKIHNLN